MRVFATSFLTSALQSLTDSVKSRCITKLFVLNYPYKIMQIEWNSYFTHKEINDFLIL